MKIEIMKMADRITLCVTIRGIFTGFILPLIVNGLLFGCAVPNKSGSPPKAETKSVSNSAKVMRFEDGREGFILSEKVNMASNMRRDFDQAVAFMEQKEYQKAVVLLEKVIEASPGVTAPYVNIAIAYRKTGKPEEAEKNLKTALELFPGHPIASNEYGLLLRKSGRFSEARNVYEQALEQFPEFLPARRNLGILCDLYLNDPQCALAQFEQYSQVRSEDEDVKLWISELRLRSGQ